MASMNQKSSVAQTPKSVRWALTSDNQEALESTMSELSGVNLDEEPPVFGLAHQRS